MHCHCDTNNRAPRWTFTDPCKPEARPGAREESASPAWLAAPAMNACDTTKGIYGGLTLEAWCGPTLYRKCHSHTTPGKRHNNTWVEPFAGNCTTSSTWQREQVWQKCTGMKRKVQSNLNINSSFSDNSFNKSFCVLSAFILRKMFTFSQHLDIVIVASSVKKMFVKLHCLPCQCFGHPWRFRIKSEFTCHEEIF